MASRCHWPSCIVASLLAIAGTTAAVAHPPSGIAVADDGRVVYVEGGTWRLVGLRPDDGVLHPIDGVPGGGSADDPARGADRAPVRPWMPHQVVRGPGGRLFTADAGTGRILEVTSDGLEAWSPPGGAPTGRPGEGGMPFAVADDGSVWWARGVPGRRMEIVRQTPGGEVRVVTGGPVGRRDGGPDVARFVDLDGGAMAWGPDGALYVTDGGRAVRRIDRDGTVRTIAGQPANEASGVDRGDDGAAAEFGWLGGLAVDAAGTVHVVDRTHRCVRTIAADGTVSVIRAAGDQTVQLDGPVGVAVDPAGSVWVLDQPAAGRGRTMVVRIDRDGVVSRFDPASPSFRRPPAPSRATSPGGDAAPGG